MINISFWGDNINKVRNNLKIKITDAKLDYSKSKDWVYGYKLHMC